jgi:hypothetical protein
MLVHIFLSLIETKTAVTKRVTIFKQHKTGSEELSVTFFTFFRDTAGVKKIAVSVHLSEGMHFHFGPCICAFLHFGSDQDNHLK